MIMVVTGSVAEFRTFCSNRGLDPKEHVLIQRAEHMLGRQRGGTVVYHGSYAERIGPDQLADIRRMCIERAHFSIIDNR